MPIYGLRIEQGIPLRELNQLSGFISKNPSRVKDLQYPEGEYDVTPVEMLWPAMLYHLTVSDRGQGILLTRPVDNDSRAQILHNGRQDPQEYRYVQNHITPDQPVLIGTANSEQGYTSDPIIYLILIYTLTQRAGNIEVASNEPRRNIVEDLKLLMRPGVEVTETQIISMLTQFNSFYKGREVTTFQVVLNKLVRHRHLLKEFRGVKRTTDYRKKK